MNLVIYTSTFTHMHTLTVNLLIKPFFIYIQLNSNPPVTDRKSLYFMLEVAGCCCLRKNAAWKKKNILALVASKLPCSSFPTVCMKDPLTHYSSTY